jgi:hypothetical protein
MKNLRKLKIVTGLIKKAEMASPRTMNLTKKAKPE